VRKLDNSSDFSCHHDDLPDYFNILVVTQLFWTMELLGVRMDHQVPFSRPQQAHRYVPSRLRRTYSGCCHNAFEVK
jgi:hypothetical protein